MRQRKRAEAWLFKNHAGLSALFRTGGLKLFCLVRMQVVVEAMAAGSHTPA